VKLKRRCLFCRRWFEPDYRKPKQCVCSRKRCRRKRKRRAWRRWALRNKPVKNLKLKQWAKAYPNYWQHYRNIRPEYRRKDNRRRNKRRRRAKNVRKANPDSPS
jgi:hypothetical protein